MKVELFPFQKKALADIRVKTAEALGSYHRTHVPQVVSFTAPTGAGKTIIMASLIENIFFGDENFAEQQDAIIIWLSDSPQLNEQSKIKIDTKADKIRLGQCVTVTEDSFDQEFFEDGHIYFLNTQKLSKTSNLTKNGDSRTYTIWQTIANTARDKSDRLYFVIDEAHRGMQGREAGKATTIMQKFLKGSEADHIPSMPVVIGMSATTERFNRLVEGTSSTIHKSVVTADEVRASGLLKDRIVITYPEKDAVNNDTAILQAAADDWKEKWDHWFQYCFEQHYAHVYPILVVQVLNGTGKNLTDTDLSDCLNKIEERTGFKFEKGQVVHTFGQTSSSINVNGLDIEYVEPSRISDDRNIRVVFFKENLSTGWDCPRAETMMSFKPAKDATYIAQLLGRMVRTPMQSHILVDDVLNDIHLYLPHFSEETVKDVVDALQSTEGGEIPTDIYGETTSEKTFDTLTVKSIKTASADIPSGQKTGFGHMDEEGHPKPSSNLYQPITSKNGGEISIIESAEKSSEIGGSSSNTGKIRITKEKDITQMDSEIERTELENSKAEDESADGFTLKQQIDPKEKPDTKAEPFNREEIMKFINDSGLLTYHVRQVTINNYLVSLFKMAHLLSTSGLHREAINEVKDEVAEMIHAYIEDLKTHNRYEDLVNLVKQFKLASQIFDAFGESVDNYHVHDLLTTTETDVDRQFRIADSKLNREGIGNRYITNYADDINNNAYKIDVILFAADEENLNKLQIYAKKRFHQFNDQYRRRIARVDSERIRRQYDSIVSDGDIVSKHNFRLPETIQVPHDEDGNEYANHLFVNDKTGVAKLKLNTWEAGVIQEEEKRNDFVCWIRNRTRASWALSIPYEIDGLKKPAYPDFIVVRKDEVLDYIIDILEPHRPDLDDNLGKAKGFAEYARQNPGVGRIQLIRMVKGVSGRDCFIRLDMSQSAIRDKVSRAMSNDELDHLFDTDGFID